MADVVTPVLSPCIGLCRLGADGLCEGCLRNGDEIMRWITMTPAQRAFYMDVELPRREAERA